ncbi:hypothetical protein P3X46_012275 [Hevea brasiliensis]|uniref:Uncharacterized protein n=1 Tax=Hevea brasiliensis TaxID=3981 RepID=A0ABQ9MCF2_HEVBR|nr:hypothetical protein P3X46_012275 [Hevea brasiliensis]
MFDVAIRNYVKESIEKIKKVEKGRSVTYSVIDGDLKKKYDPYRLPSHSFPLKVKKASKAKFEPLTLATPLPEKARDAALGFPKSFYNFKLHI